MLNFILNQIENSYFSAADRRRAWQEINGLLNTWQELSDWLQLEEVVYSLGLLIGLLIVDAARWSGRTAARVRHWWIHRRPGQVAVVQRFLSQHYAWYFEGAIELLPVERRVIDVPVAAALPIGFEVLAQQAVLACFTGEAA